MPKEDFLWVNVAHEVPICDGCDKPFMKDDMCYDIEITYRAAPSSMLIGHKHFCRRCFEERFDYEEWKNYNAKYKHIEEVEGSENRCEGHTLCWVCGRSITMEEATFSAKHDEYVCRGCLEKEEVSN